MARFERFHGLQTCAVLNFRDCQIEYYDSLLGVDKVTINSLLRWVEDESADKYGSDVPDEHKVCKSSTAATWHVFPSEL